MEGAGWLSQSFQPPEGTEVVDGKAVPKPSPKPPQPHQSGPPLLSGVRGDAELSAFLRGGRPRGNRASGVAVVEYGTSWCAKCHEMAPTFVALAKKYSQHAYAVAQLETLSAPLAAGLRYSPTFALYRGGVKVDEVVGKEPQRLEDHLWLHTDE